MDFDTPLYRYYNLKGFLSLMANRVIRFRKITEWPDKYEGGSYKHITQSRGCAALPCDCFWGSCWTQETDIPECYDNEGILKIANEALQRHGSAGMWGSYCEDCGVRVKSSLGKIRHAIQSTIGGAKLIDGPVMYVPHIVVTEDPLKMLFHKMTPFRHESEYRFIVIDEAKELERLDVATGNPFDFFDEMVVGSAANGDAWIVDTIYQAIVSSAFLGSNNKDGKQYARKSRLFNLASENLTRSWLRFNSVVEVQEELKRHLE